MFLTALMVDLASELGSTPQEGTTELGTSPRRPLNAHTAFGETLGSRRPAPEQVNIGSPRLYCVNERLILLNCRIVAITEAGVI